MVKKFYLLLGKQGHLWIHMLALGGGGKVAGKESSAIEESSVALGSMAMEFPW